MSSLYQKGVRGDARTLETFLSVPYGRGCCRPPPMQHTKTSSVPIIVPAELVLQVDEDFGDAIVEKDVVTAFDAFLEP